MDGAEINESSLEEPRITTVSYTSLTAAHTDCIIKKNALDDADKTTRQVLYSLLSSLMEFRALAVADPANFDELCKTHSIPVTAKSGIYIRLINLLWGKSNKQTKSALRYAKVLEHAELNKIQSANLSTWISSQGGIEEILKSIKTQPTQPTDAEMEEARKLVEKMLGTLTPVFSFPTPVTTIPEGHSVALVRTTGKSTEIVRVLNKKYRVDAEPLKESIAEYERIAGAFWAPLDSLKVMFDAFSPHAVLIRNDLTPAASFLYAHSDEKSVPFLRVKLAKPIPHFPSGVSVWDRWQFPKVYAGYAYKEHLNPPQMIEEPSNPDPSIMIKKLVWKEKGQTTVRWYSYDDPSLRTTGIEYQKPKNNRKGLSPCLRRHEMW